MSSNKSQRVWFKRCRLVLSVMSRNTQPSAVDLGARVGGVLLERARKHCVLANLDVVQVHKYKRTGSDKRQRVNRNKHGQGYAAPKIWTARFFG